MSKMTSEEFEITLAQVMTDAGLEPSATFEELAKASIGAKTQPSEMTEDEAWDQEKRRREAIEADQSGYESALEFIKV